MGSGISGFFWDRGSGFDMKYGIRDQRIFWDLGSGFDIKYGVWDQRFFFIRNKNFSFQLGTGSLPHEILGIRSRNRIDK